MQDYEKLGAFYIGREYDLTSGKTASIPVLYKSKDFTTHAVIIGMTGSGKTGLGIAMIEEAAIDQIPVIAIDPKGDLGNLMLTFPNLGTDDFLPWVNLSEAQNKGMTAREYAQNQAESWKKGLADWDQDGGRIQKLIDSVDISVYTPGSSAGRGVSVLRSFNAPKEKVRNDAESYFDSIHSTTTGLLSLVGIDSDPLTSRENILISNILENIWNTGRDISLEELIALVQDPPMDRVGVMEINRFYPAADRFALAMRLNNLLASPGFQTWLDGDALDIDRFMYNESGKPCISVFSLAHLSDNERMFFVTMLLNEIVSWMRSQPGTGSLRALLYMDELFGYLPPTANPPSKNPLMTLLKQARAYGLGLVLSTQNPVDIDYKALSNSGTWFIGRLQTERDKDRVIAGLEGAAAGGSFDKRKTEQILAGLDKRIFYLHSVHEDEPLIFSTRWVMSYLAGPLTRDQISMLPVRYTKSKKEIASAPDIKEKTVAVDVTNKADTERQPVLPQQIRQYFISDNKRSTDSAYIPGVIAAADVFYSNAKHNLAFTRRVICFTPMHKGPVSTDWKESIFLDIEVNDLEETPSLDIRFSEIPPVASDIRSYEVWKKQFMQYIRTEQPLRILRSPVLNVISDPEEDERKFRIRMLQIAHERRDDAMDEIRKKYGAKVNTLKDRQLKARQTLENEIAKAARKRMDVAINTGTAILGVLFGNRTLSSSSISKAGTAIRSRSRASQSSTLAIQAQETLNITEMRLNELETALEAEVNRLFKLYNIKEEALEEILIRPVTGNINVLLIGLGWRLQ